jgi:acyl dehydratase
MAGTEPLLTFEDLTPGRSFSFPPRALSRKEIVDFATQWDPQPFHLDEAAARASHFGGLVASGWQTGSLCMRMIAEGLLNKSTSMGSPGIDEMRWIKPVRPDDPLTLTVSVLEARPSRSKPDRGTVRLGYLLVNGAGETVMTLACWVMFRRRPPAVVKGG